MGQALKVIKFNSDDKLEESISSGKSFNTKFTSHLVPLRSAAIITAILGIISLVLEVHIYFQYRYEIYLARLFPTILSLIALIILHTKFAKKNHVILTHIYLFTILASLSFVGSRIPSLFAYNLTAAALFILTLSLFLFWGRLNQIIACGYFLLLFGASTFLSNIVKIENEIIYLLLTTSPLILLISVIASHLREKSRAISLEHDKTSSEHFEFNDGNELNKNGFVANSVIPIFKCKSDGSVEFMNKALYDLLDFPSDANYSETNLFDDIIKNEKVKKHILKKIESKGRVENYRFKLFGKGEEEEILLMDCNSKIIGDDKFLEGSLRNITSQYKTDKSLRREIETLKQNKRQNSKIIPSFSDSSVKKSNVISKMGHELRTPMNSVLGFLTLIENGLFENDEELKEFSHSAKLSAESLLGLINDVVEIAKIQEGIVEVEKSEFNIKEEVEKICSDLMPHLEQNELSLSIKINDDIPDKIISDQSKYIQIVKNLLRNGIQGTESGTITLSVGTQRTNDGNTLLLTSIEDSSEGIEQIELDKLINENNSGKEITSKITSNVLHLLICKELITLLDGHISATSEIGKGTKFSFSIDLEKAEESSGDADSNEVKFEAKYLTKPKLLLVEDNPISRKVEQKLLQEAGYKVDCVESGAEAVEFVEKGSYNLVLMDIELKDMDGLEATKRIRELPNKICNIPIIAVTAHSSMKDREKCLISGMNDYISKPINITFLKMTIDQWLNEAKVK